jgi:hypothetical protein
MSTAPDERCSWLESEVNEVGPGLYHVNDAANLVLVTAEVVDPSTGQQQATRSPAFPAQHRSEQPDRVVV